MNRRGGSSVPCRKHERTLAAASILAAFWLAGCSGGDQVASTSGSDTSNANCTGSCATATSNLAAADVQQILAQGIAEAQAQGVNATFAVVDRVGNVLAVYRMGNATMRSVTLTTTAVSGGTVTGGLEGIRLPTAATPTANLDDQAAIAKAVTGAYLSSEGNAFSSRTASQIVQEHFNPGEMFQPAGPLFGVQFSQLACSDFINKAVMGGAATVGPQRSPLGLSADPGGFPLYKGGTVVGGVGVMADGIYGIDRNILDQDMDLDETIALAATFGFGAPVDRRGDRITVDGKTARFTDVEMNQLKSNPASAPAFNTIAVGVGALITVTGYFDGTIRDGTAFGQPASGIRPDDGTTFPGQDAFVFVDTANNPRFPPIAGTDGATALTSAEVLTVLRSALDVANRARAQIRRPTGSQARVTISVVDSQGVILGMVRTRDAPVFGADVSLQKARTAALMSSPGAAAFLSGLPNANYLVTSDTALSLGASIPIASYVTNLRAFMGEPNQLSDGRAFSDRANGNLSRPFYPDGIDDSGINGPLSKPPGQWSVFSTGMQFDIANNAILQHVLFVATMGALPDVAPGCPGVSLASNLTATQTIAGVQAANGLQIFPGSVPIFRGGTLVGGIGVSGDGVDQDDMVAFLGLFNAGQTLGTIGNAPMGQRSDALTPQGTRLRYVQCPQAPFVNSDLENVCGGK
jgi:uncharacterized protein GlcG (DUF336 family)